MDSKSSYLNSFLAELDKKFEAIFDAIDLPNIDLAILKLRCARYSRQFDKQAARQEPSPRGGRVRHGVKLRRIK